MKIGPLAKGFDARSLSLSLYSLQYLDIGFRAADRAPDEADTLDEGDESKKKLKKATTKTTTTTTTMASQQRQQRLQQWQHQKQAAANKLCANIPEATLAVCMWVPCDGAPNLSKVSAAHERGRTGRYLRIEEVDQALPIARPDLTTRTNQPCTKDASKSTRHQASLRGGIAEGRQACPPRHARFSGNHHPDGVRYGCQCDTDMNRVCCSRSGERAANETPRTQPTLPKRGRNLNVEPNALDD